MRVDEIPNSQIKDAADQFAAGANLLSKQPPLSGLLLPTINSSIIACELYLKSLNAKSDYSDHDEFGFRQVFAVPNKHGHPLTRQYDELAIGLQESLSSEFSSDRRFSDPNLRNVLAEFDNTFQVSRYMFERQNAKQMTELKYQLLLNLCEFLRGFVSNMEHVLIVNQNTPPPKP